MRLIDIHTHGAFGINFNYATYDEMKYLLFELYKKGIKGICPTLVGDNDDNIQKQLKLFQKIQQEQLDKFSNEAYLIGAHLEGSFLSPKKPGIQDISVFKKPTKENFEKLTGKYKSIVKIVTIAPEEDVDLINYLNSEKIITQAGHSNSTTTKGTKGITHLFNAMNSIHHRTPSIALESLIKDNIYTEVIADLIHLSKDILTLILKVKPKNKIILVSDSLPSSNFDKDIIFCNKKINNSGKDEKGTLAGSNKTLDEICENLLQKKYLTNEDITLMGFKNQIKYLNLSEKEINILNR